MVKNLPANTEDLKEKCSISGLGRSPGGGHGNPLQYSCLENPMNKGAWQATVHKIAESDRTEGTWRACMHQLSCIVVCVPWCVGLSSFSTLENLGFSVITAYCLQILRKRWEQEGKETDPGDVKVNSASCLVVIWGLYNKVFQVYLKRGQGEPWHWDGF